MKMCVPFLVVRQPYTLRYAFLLWPASCVSLFTPICAPRKYWVKSPVHHDDHIGRPPEGGLAKSVPASRTTPQDTPRPPLSLHPRTPPGPALDTPRPPENRPNPLKTSPGPSKTPPRRSRDPPNPQGPPPRPLTSPTKTSPGLPQVTHPALGRPTPPQETPRLPWESHRDLPNPNTLRRELATGALTPLDKLQPEIVLKTLTEFQIKLRVRVAIHDYFV